MRAVQWLAGCDLAMGLGVGFWWLGIGGLETEAARGLNRAQKDLQNVQGARGLKAVGMGRDAAHGMHGDGAAGHCFVGLAAEICPFLLDFKGFVEGHTGQFCGQRADAVRC